MTTTGALPANPFPGMNPYLEAPGLWPGVYNRTIVGLGNQLARRLRPEYRVGIEERVQISAEPGGNGSGGGEVGIVGIRIPDAVVLAGVGASGAPSSAGGGAMRFPMPERSKDAIAVRLPATELSKQRYLEVRRADNRQVVAVIELLSPGNKDGYGRREYLAKRAAVLSSPAHLVEIDLLRGGQRMPVVGAAPDACYRILVANARRAAPVADLYPFGIRQAVPDFVLPLAQADEGIAVNLNGVVKQVYADGSYDLDVDYGQEPPEPALSDDDRRWVDGMLRGQGLR